MSFNWIKIGILEEEEVERKEKRSSSVFCNCPF